jgi:hypothetical protein
VERGRSSGLVIVAIVATFASACVAGPAGAATREPVSILRAALSGERIDLSATGSGNADPPPAASASAFVPGDALPIISSTVYGAEQTEAVARVVADLDHGAGLASQRVFVATPEEVAVRCGEAVIACYFPAASEMVISGIRGARGGVPWEFAIAHEFGHAIAASQASPIGSAMQTGTIRWATYERVCQLSGAGVLFPGNQGGHYWQDPEEAFAETYASLADPSASVRWQFSPFLAPTPASLAEVRADIAQPWAGPQTRSWDGTVVAAPAAGTSPQRWGTNREAITSTVSLGPPSGTVIKDFATPLDGEVDVSLATAPATPLVVRLVDPGAGRVLARSRTDVGGNATISFQNCGHETLQAQVRSLAGAASFEAQITRP